MITLAKAFIVVVTNVPVFKLFFYNHLCRNSLFRNIIMESGITYLPATQPRLPSLTESRVESFYVSVDVPSSPLSGSGKAAPSALALSVA